VAWTIYEQWHFSSFMSVLSTGVCALAHHRSKRIDSMQCPTIATPSTQVAIGALDLFPATQLNICLYPCTEDACATRDDSMHAIGERGLPYTSPARVQGSHAVRF